MPERQRPTGITILAVLAMLSVGFGFIALFGGLGGAPGALPIGVILTIVGVPTVYGLWNLRPWAWPLALVLWGLSTLDALLLLSNGTLNTNLIVGPLVILYLMRADIRTAFGRGPGA
jgi:hypothetical protein